MAGFRLCTTWVDAEPRVPGPVTLHMDFSTAFPEKSGMIDVVTKLPAMVPVALPTAPDFHTVLPSLASAVSARVVASMANRSTPMPMAVTARKAVEPLGENPLAE